VWFWQQGPKAEPAPLTQPPAEVCRVGRAGHPDGGGVWLRWLPAPPQHRLLLQKHRDKAVSAPVLEAMPPTQVNNQMAVLNKLKALTTPSSARHLPAAAFLLGLAGLGRTSSACTRAEPGPAWLHRPSVKSPLHFHRAVKVVCT